MDSKFRKLIELGAGGFEYLDSSVIAHLESTRCLLKEWNADLALQEAGLYYIAYLENESGFIEIGTELRKDVAKILGSKVENVIYHYYVWDKLRTFKQQLDQGEFVYFNKISAELEPIPHIMQCQLCELFVAIELDKASIGGKSAPKGYAAEGDLFSNLEPYLSPPANRKIKLMHLQ